MQTRLRWIFAVLALAGLASAQPAPAALVLVKGGLFQNARSNYHGKNVAVSDFYLGRHEVTQKEWVEVMGDNPSKFKGDDLPVETVSWYACVMYCNQRSLQEGLRPCYTIDRDTRDPGNENERDDARWTVTLDPEANGYRLPTEAEWEYAAGGGRASRGHLYSGSDEVDAVAWHWRNAGDRYLMGLWHWSMVEQNHNRPRPVGRKAPNELGLYDMSGNVREWCWDWQGELSFDTRGPRGAPRGASRVWKGGGWLGGEFCCEPSFRGGFEPNGTGGDQGFRVCRNGD
jgi:formylglycine-generating enzyme